MSNKMDSEFLKIVGIRIMEARVKSGLSQERVAAMINFSRPQLANIETGNCGTTSENMYKLSVIFNCPISELYPLPNQYKPKLKAPPPKKSEIGRRLHSKPYLLAKENEQLKKELQQLKTTTNEQ